MRYTWPSGHPRRRAVDPLPCVATIRTTYGCMAPCGAGNVGGGMQEVRVTLPEGQGSQVVQVAFQVGIADVAVYRVEAPGAKAWQEIVSAEVATPVAQAFVDAVLAAPFYDSQT